MGAGSLAWSGLAGVGRLGLLGLSAPAAKKPHGPECVGSLHRYSQVNVNVVNVEVIDKVELGSSSAVHSVPSRCFDLIHGLEFGVVSWEAVEFKSGEL